MGLRAGARATLGFATGERALAGGDTQGVWSAGRRWREGGRGLAAGAQRADCSGRCAVAPAAWARTADPLRPRATAL